MLGMTLLFSWCQRNLQLSQSSSQICAINSCTFQTRRLNYVSTRQKGLTLDTDFLLGQLHPPRSKSTCCVQQHILYLPRQPALSHSASETHLMLQNEDHFPLLNSVHGNCQNSTIYCHYYNGGKQASEERKAMAPSLSQIFSTQLSQQLQTTRLLVSGGKQAQRGASYSTTVLQKTQDWHPDLGEEFCNSPDQASKGQWDYI